MNSAKKTLLGRVLSLTRSNYYNSFVWFITLFLPLSATAILLFFVIDPIAADSLATEDGFVENLSVLLLFLATSIALIVSVRSFIKKNVPLGVMMAIAAIGLFVIGMEEISWTQRLIGFETTGAFQELNQQGEMNLHNLDTRASETIYYLGAFILLVLLPFYSKLVGMIFASKKWLKSLRPLVPAAWLLVPFSIMMGFVKTSETYVSPLYMIAFLFTVAALLHLIFSSLRVNKYRSAFIAVVSLVLLIFSFVFFTTYDYRALGVRDHVATEYKEFFIALGLLAYVVVISRKTILFDRHTLG